MESEPEVIKERWVAIYTYCRPVLRGIVWLAMGAWGWGPLLFIVGGLWALGAVVLTLAGTSPSPTDIANVGIIWWVGGALFAAKVLHAAWITKELGSNRERISATVFILLLVTGSSYIGAEYLIAKIPLLELGTVYVPPHIPPPADPTDSLSTLRHTSRVTAPDLSAKFVYPDEVALELFNYSEKTVQRPSVLAQVWDLDKPKEQAFLNVPIGIAPDSFIKNGSYMVPLTFLGRSEVKNRISKGDRIVGWITVTCPDCARTRGYWFYVIAGKGGWYAECPKGQYPNINSISHNWEAIRVQGEAALNLTVPPESRKVITDTVP